MLKKLLISAVVVLVLLLCPNKLSAQRYGNFLGSASHRQETPEEIAAREAKQRQQIQLLLKGHPLRRVNGKIVNMYLNGQLIKLQVESKIDGIIIGQSWSDNKRFAVKNFGGKAIADETIEIVAVTNGAYDDSGTPLELYDCGAILPPEEEQNELADLNEKYTKAQQQARALQNAKNKEATAKAEESKAKVLKLNQEQADRGEVYGLLRMGQRYRDGDGVEKNLAKARDYLTKAVAAGSQTAADELKQLPAN